MHKRKVRPVDKRTAPWGKWEDKSETLKDHPLNQLFSRIHAAWTNQVLSVQISDEATDWGTVTHLWVRRHDQQPTTWGELQRVKNELVGVDRVGVEVMPAVADLVDQAKAMYHVYVLPEGFQLPFGLHLRGNDVLNHVVPAAEGNGQGVTLLGG